MGRGGRKSDSLPKGEEMVTALVKVEDGIGAFGLQEAPVYFPTEEEFANPLRYIAQIRAQAEAYGICRIVPPSSWNPPFGLDTVKFTFPTKLQAIHHLQERPAAWDADTFKLEYVRFLRKTGETIERWPLLDGEELDLCKLFNAVKRYGGHEKVTLEKRWREVVRMVLAETSVAHSSSSTAAILCQLYEKHLSTFELYQTKVGSGKRWRARAKQEANPSEKQTSDKPRRGGRKRSSGSGDSVDLEEAGGGVGDRAGAGKQEDELSEVLRPAGVEGETRSQSKRFGRRRQSRSSGGLNLEGSGVGAAENKESDSSAANDLTEVLRPPTGGQVESPSQSHPPVQRKRRKTNQQEKVAVREEGLGRTDQICEQCHSGAHEQLMLLCDRCDRGWHLYCLSPPLSTVPVGNWYCLECLGSESESFGFGQGQEYSFDSFRRMADRFKRKWVGTRPSSYADLEREFWRVVEGQTAPVEVLYGSDLDTGRYGSGFPRASEPTPSWSSVDAWDEGARNPWNVNNFPKLEGSMLRLVHDNIPGVMVPWLYIGMLFSSFCWHYEDHCFYSVNYLHCGEPKSWYSVPGTAAEDFEKVMRNAFPDLFEAQPDLLFQLVTMLNPSVLRDNGVPVYMAIQEPRNFVITFPRSYHGGFNHGFNCAEAVNFAPSDWLPYGGFGVERYRLFHKAAVLSHDELLCVVAKNEASCRETPWLFQELTRIVTKERHQRESLWSLGMTKSSQMASRPSPNHIGAEEDEECIICRYYLHLSAVVCQCRPGKAVCLQHARQLCECGAEQQSLLYRFTLAELDDMVGSEDCLGVCKIEDVGAAPGNNKRRLRRAQLGSLSLNNSLTKKVKGRRYRHSELADSWLNQARGAGRTNLRSPLLEDLLSQAEQFLWGGHDMDEVRVMVQKLNAAHNWVRDVAACAVAIEKQGHSGSGKAAKVSLAAVHKLVTVDPVPWKEPHLQTLKALFEPACKLEKLIMESVAGSADVEIRVLQGLLQEANHSPFEYPGLQELKDVIHSAQTWSDRVRKALCCTKTLRNRSRNNEVTFKHLQALHAEGSKIHVAIQEKERLASAIQSVEAWRHRALELFASSCTRHDLEECFKESELLVVHPVEVDRLEDLLHKVQGWSKRAGDALLQVGLRTDYEGSVTMIDDLLQEGQGLHVYGLEEMGLLKVERQKVSWMHAASQAAREYPAVNVLQDLIADARRLQLADCKLGVELANTSKDASAWEVKAEQALSSRGSLSIFTELASSAEGIHAKLSTLKPIQQAREEARLWLDRAQSFSKPASVTTEDGTAKQMDLSTLRELVVGLQKLPVVVEDGESFSSALAAAETWISKAETLKTTCFVTKQKERQMQLDLNKRMDVGGQQVQRTSPSFLKADDDSSCRLQGDLVALQDAIHEGLSLRLNLPEITELQGLHVATGWCLKARHFVECSPVVKEVEDHLEEATTLSVTAPEYLILQEMVSDTKAWLQDAAPFMTGFGTKGNCSEEQLEKLIADAKVLPISVASETGCLNDILASHRSWKTKAQDALSGKAVLAWSELLKLQGAGEADMVHTDEQDILSREVFSAGSWMLRCHEGLARQPAYQEVALEEVFVKMRSSVKLGMEYLEDDTRNTRERKCICQRPINKSETNALHCDVCGDGYHPSCLGVTQLTRGQKQYVCPFCTATSGGVLSTNKELSSKIHATQRPRLSQLRDLLSCSQKFKCRLREKEVLEEIVTFVERFEIRLRLLIEPALVSLDKRNAVNYLTLVAAQKAVEALEVRSEHGSLLQTVLAVNSWRQKVIELLEDPAKPLPRTLTRSLKEGLAIPVSGEDVVLKELKEIEASACLWAACAKEVINDQGRMPLTEVQALIMEGEELPVAFGKELSALRERSVLYCVCKKPYDEDRAMIACDRCGEWYHFNCIDLPEPESSDEDTDVAVQQESSGDFVCPHCKEVAGNEDRQSPGVVLARSYSKEDSEDTVIRKGGEGSRFEGLVRGKRSNRSSNKARGDVRHKWQSPLFAPGKLLWHTQRRRKQQEQPDNSVSASGRPCRRTAGRHSGFESFVLLMRSR